MSENEGGAPVVAFRKVRAKKKQQQIRKREAPKDESAGSSDADSDAGAGSSTAAKRLAKKRSKMIQSVCFNSFTL